MDNLIKKVEEKVTAQLEKLEKEPVKTTIKAVVVLYVAKKIYNFIKE